jgi:hypothetical protein
MRVTRMLMYACATTLLIPLSQANDSSQAPASASLPRYPELHWSAHFGSGDAAALERKTP